MIEKSNKRAVWVGLFVFLGITFLVVGTLLVGNLHGTFKKKLKVVSLFDDINGLQTGNNVWFSGVKIGTVSDIHFYGKSQVLVTINLELKAQEYIRKDAKVKISTDGLIGNKILVVYGGTPKAKEVQPGDTLDVESTFSSEDMINMLQENNKNILAITNDFKSISKGLAAGEGSIGKLLTESTLYDNLNKSVLSLQIVSSKAGQMVGNLNAYTENLNKEGTLANDLVTDTVVFSSLRYSILQFQQVVDTASVFISNLKSVSNQPGTPIGVLLQDKDAGTDLKQTFQNLERGSFKLDEDLEAAQHSIFLRRFFRKRDKE
jgi:phospholipid/cholesterol/gamma-HCH transport system substrate-binding protein